MQMLDVIKQLLDIKTKLIYKSRQHYMKWTKEKVPIVEIGSVMGYICLTIQLRQPILIWPLFVMCNWLIWWGGMAN